ncbi:hypothetical protein JCM5353_005799 [Sporobolomyces roseus]
MSSLPLPVELIQDILEEVMQSSALNHNHRQRTSFLAMCCLVSKSFLNVVRPILYSIVHTRDDDELNRFLTTTEVNGLGGYVKRAHFKTVRSFNRMISRLPALQDLRLSPKNLSMEDLVKLQKLKHLRSLAVECHFLDSLCRGKLEALEDLTIGMRWDTNLSNLLNHNRLPSLQAVALLDYEHRPINKRIDTLPTLVWDLRALAIDFNLAECLCDSDVGRLGMPTLVASNLRIIKASTTARFGQLGTVSSPLVPSSLPELALWQTHKIINSTTLPVDTVVLPARLHDSSIVGTIEKIWYDSLIDICKMRRIDVLHEEGWGSELMVPKVLIKKVRSQDQVGET